MTTATTRTALTLCLSLLMLAAAGCQMNRDNRVPGEDVGLSLRASSDRLVVGEIATITAETRNTYGRNVRLEWNASSGELMEEQGGRVARVRTTEPGPILVRANLYSDDRLVATDSVQIRVNPLR